MSVPSVLHVVLSLSPGGTERLVIELSKRTAPTVRGVVCLDETGAWSGELTNRGIAVQSLGRQPGFHPGLAFALARAARRSGATILHCHHYTPFVYGRFAALLAPDLRLVFTEHGRLSDATPSRKRRIMNPLLARFRGTVHAVSHDLMHHMVASGFPVDRIEVVHNGIDAGPPVTAADGVCARRQLGLSGDGPVLGTAARLDSVKDLATLLRAMVTLKQRWPAIRLVVIGDGPERDRLASLAQELRLAENLLFTGHRDNARSLFPAFDLYVNSSISEGISLTLLEAMAASRAIVATRVGGTPEVVEHGTTGLLVSARSADELSTSVARLLDSPARRLSMGEAGRSRVERVFSVDRMVAQYADIYERAQRS